MFWRKFANFVKSGCISRELASAFAKATAGSRRARLQQSWHPQIKDQPVARGGADHSEFIHDRSHHSVGDHGQDGFTYRALGDDVHAAKGIRQRGVHLFYPRNFSDANLRAFRLWLGLSHSRVAGSLRLALKENGSSSEAVSVASARVCPDHRGAVHVCLARRISTVHGTAGTAYPQIHQSSGDHKFLADVPFGRGGASRFCLFAAS